MLVVLYAASAIYFAGVMVRLMLTLTPIVCVFAAIAFSHTLENYLVEDPVPEKEKKTPAGEAPAPPSAPATSSKVIPTACTSIIS